MERIKRTVYKYGSDFLAMCVSVYICLSRHSFAIFGTCGSPLELHSRMSMVPSETTSFSIEKLFRWTSDVISNGSPGDRKAVLLKKKGQLWVIGIGMQPSEFRKHTLNLDFRGILCHKCFTVYQRAKPSDRLSPLELYTNILLSVLSVPV